MNLLSQSFNRYLVVVEGTHNVTTIGINSRCRSDRLDIEFDGIIFFPLTLIVYPGLAS